MKTKQYRILDAPEAGDVFPVLLFAFPLFFTGTFMLTLMGTGLEDNHVALSWIDVGLHLLAMLVAVLPMREYLSFSWLAVSGDNKARIPRCFWIGVAVLAYATMLPQLPLPKFLEPYRWCSDSVMPLLTIDLFNTSAYFVMISPIVATICAVFVAPLVTCCMFYATVFVKGYNVRPWLGYLLLVPATVFIPICTGVFGWWAPEGQFVMWAMRLPVHLLYCKLYADTDNIWMPIFTQATVNLIACLIVIFLW